MSVIMDGVRNELPKLGHDTRSLLEIQRIKRDEILKETEEYEQRAKYLRNKVKEIEDKIFTTPMGTKIKELVKENLNLSIDAQCLSIELDIQNQMDNRGVSESTFYRNSPVYPNQGHQMGNQMAVMNRGNTPTTSSNVVTLDTSTYPYAHVVSPNVGNMSPYPIQQGMPTMPYPMTGNRNHLSPHHEPQRQMSQISPTVHVNPNFYGYNRQGSLSILNQVPPPAPIHSSGGWMQPGNYPMSPALNPGPPVPPRPSDLPLRNHHGQRTLPTPPHRPVPPPPTPPKPSRSPNMERPRSSNDIIDHREEDENLVWECTACTFQNHSAMNVCEMCGNSRVGSLGTINRSPN